MKRLLPISVLVGLIALTPVGCAAMHSGPYTSQDAGSRSPLQAEELTMQAADLIDHEPDKAERLLRQALSHDLYHGPAHNNLGVLYLKQGKLYEAASEFEWARKLMPGHPDPRMNLALTLEKAGRIDEAAETYAKALEVYPEHIPTLQALTRLQVRYDRVDEKTRERLKIIALRGRKKSWRQWAQEQLALTEPSGNE